MAAAPVAIDAVVHPVAPGAAVSPAAIVHLDDVDVAVEVAVQLREVEATEASLPSRFPKLVTKWSRASSSFLALRVELDG